MCVVFANQDKQNKRAKQAEREGRRCITIIMKATTHPPNSDAAVSLHHCIDKK